MTASNYFVPGNKTIINIARGRTTVVSTDLHGYTSGLVVRFVIPPSSGIQQINNIMAKIIVINVTTFFVDIDSSTLDPFIPNITPSKYWKTIPQVIPVGDSGTGFEDSSLNNNNIVPEIYPPAPYPAHP